MRAFPSGLAVVAVDLEGERVGLTVGSLISLSLDPPLVGIAISRQAALHELLRAAGRFGVSLLAADQAHVAQHFARGVPPIAMWRGISWRPGRSGVPLLEDAVGWIESDVVGEHVTGDHTFFVGDVLACERGRLAPALVYVEQRYRASA